MDDIYDELVRIKNSGEVCALATIVKVKGSTPRAAGAKMLVRADGSIMGSIGGGCVEASVWTVAMEVIKQEATRTQEFDLTGRETTEEGLICGGTLQVLVEPVIPQPTVHIFGAGHIGYAVAKIAKITGFRVAVIDDRPAYADKMRCPEADEVYVADPAEAVARLNLNRYSFVVIACRGHLEDQEVLAEVLKTKAGYIGLVASRKKARTIRDNLLAAGFSEDDLKRLRSPAGIPIATDTPEEIAVSIMGEVIDSRRLKKKN